MKGFIKKLVTRVAKGQGGFTLIEMIVVVGIIAVLAAVIIPNIGRFIGSGESGALTAEEESVQTAMNAMMAEHSLTAFTEANTSSTNSWSALPVSTAKDADGNDVFLDSYLQSTTTVYFYCYDTNGQIINSNDDDNRKASATC